MDDRAKIVLLRRAIRHTLDYYGTGLNASVYAELVGALAAAGEDGEYLRALASQERTWWARLKMWWRTR